MLTLKFFASLREAIGHPEEHVAWDGSIASVGQLKAQMARRGGAWSRLTEQKNLRCAVNQEMAIDATALKDGDEVAFFPPVTGG